MTILGKSILAATVGVAALAASSLTASAYIACSGKVCWHVSERHNYPAHARVVIQYRPELLELEVRDDGRGSVRNPRPGQGLVGMRERAALLGGTLDVRPMPGRGFRVLASLPVKSGAG